MVAFTVELEQMAATGDDGIYRSQTLMEERQDPPTPAKGLYSVTGTGNKAERAQRDDLANIALLMLAQALDDHVRDLAILEHVCGKHKELRRFNPEGLSVELPCEWIPQRERKKKSPLVSMEKAAPTVWGAPGLSSVREREFIEEERMMASSRTVTNSRFVSMLLPPHKSFGIISADVPDSRQERR